MTLRDMFGVTTKLIKQTRLNISLLKIESNQERLGEKLLLSTAKSINYSLD